MPLPSPDKAREILNSYEEERRLKQEAERARKKKESAFRKTSKEEIDAILKNAIKLAYDGESFMPIQPHPISEVKNLIQEGLEDLGFEVFKTSTGVRRIEMEIESIDLNRFAPILKTYDLETYKLIQHINSWLAVRYNRDGTYQNISSQLIPLIFDPIKISFDTNDWPQILKCLDSWIAISGWDEPGTYELSSLVLDDYGFNKASRLTDLTLNPAREKALVEHAKHLRKLALELNRIQESEYGNLRVTLEKLRRFPPDATLLSWSSANGIVTSHGKLSAWLLAWISNADGKDFLDDLTFEIESLARLGVKELDLGEAIYQLEEVGLNNQDLLALLHFLGFEASIEKSGMVVQWN